MGQVITLSAYRFEQRQGIERLEQSDQTLTMPGQRADEFSINATAEEIEAAFEQMAK